MRPRLDSWKSSLACSHGPSGRVATRARASDAKRGDAIIFSPIARESTSQVIRLIASPTSPYVRKVRIALAEKKIEYQLVEMSPWTPDNPVHEWSPLGKVPVLVLDDGTR